MCNICNGYPGCPCCSTSNTLLMTCPDCDGKAITYYDGDGNEITESQHSELSECDRFSEICPTCEGTGDKEYEPDYEPEYEKA